MQQPKRYPVELGDVVGVARRLAGELRATHPGEAGVLEEAISVESGAAERLLALRSALIRTRGVWETTVAGDTAALARTILAGAKRFAIELDDNAAEESGDVTENG